MPITVALVIMPSGTRSDGNCASAITPRSASGRKWTSIALSLPSAPLTEVDAIKSPDLMSATLFFTTPETVKFGARAIVTSAPSRDFTTNVCPSSLSTMPRIRVGVPSGGGVCARAGPTVRATRAAASAIFRMGHILPVHALRMSSAEMARHPRLFRSHSSERPGERPMGATWRIIDHGIKVRHATDEGDSPGSPLRSGRNDGLGGSADA